MIDKLLFGATGAFAVALVALWIAFVVGWILNLIKIVSIAFNSFAGNEVEVIVRAVGVFFAPLGAVAGWL